MINCDVIVMLQMRLIMSVLQKMMQMSRVSLRMLRMLRMVLKMDEIMRKTEFDEIMRRWI